MSKIECRLFTVGGNYNSTHNIDTIVNSGVDDTGHTNRITDSADVYRGLIGKRDYREKMLPVLCVTTMMAIMYLILGPLEIFYTNYKEFQFNSYDFIWFFIAISIVAIIVIPLVIGSLPKIVSVIYCVIVLGFGIGSYIQYMFINGELVDNEGNFALDMDLGDKYYASIAIFILTICIIAVVSVVCKQYRKMIYIRFSVY